MTEKTLDTQTEAIAFQWDLRHPPEKVWRALTDPALLSQWLLPAIGFKAEAGTEFKFAAPPQPEWDGVVNCRMLEVDQFKKVSWSWIVGDIDTVVTFTLTPTDSGTQLTLVQSGFKPHQKRNVGGARYGWKMMSEKLMELLPLIATTQES